MDREDIKQGKLYFIKAVILVAALMLVEWLAPYLPSVFIPFILVAFSLISTIGALYYTVVKHLHRQYELNAKGRLSKINRRWTFKLVGFLVLFMFSAFFFLLEAPKWDALEWILTWVAIPVYFVVFTIAQRSLKEEFGPKFYKARAMKWSFVIVGVVLCILYALLSLLLPSTDYSSLAEAFELAPKPYENSPSALMSEVSKLSSLSEGFTSFGISRVSEMSFFFGIVCEFIIYASVFFGLVNQFGFCLLTTDEIRSEFQLLPAHDEDADAESGVSDAPATSSSANNAHRPIRYLYVLIVAAVLLVAVVTFLSLEFEAAKAQATQEYTEIDKFVDDQIENATFFVDGAYDRFKNLEAYLIQIEELRKERDNAISPMLDEYYGACKQNIDFYLEWYDGPAGTWARIIKNLGNFGANDAISAFKERIVNGVSDTEIQHQYKQYQERINKLIYEASSLVPEDGGDQQPGLLDRLTAATISQGYGDLVLNLWEPLEGADGIKVANDVLIATDTNLDREGLKNKISELIDSAHTDASEKLKEGLN